MRCWWIALALTVGISGCATPVGVPRNATFHLGYISGNTWEWRRALAHGCAMWSIFQTGGGSVELFTDRTQCARFEWGNRSIAEGPPEVLYYTFSDSLEFNRIYSIPSYAGQETGEPCPHPPSSDEIAAYRLLVREGLASATTDAERRTYARIDEHLAVLNGATMTTSQWGCTGDAFGQTRTDPWSAN